MIRYEEKSISFFTIYLRSKKNDKLNYQLIEPIVKKFFFVRGVNKYKNISEGYEISYLDVKNINFSYFYDYVFFDVIKNKKNIEFNVKYCITLDKNSCPKKCKKTGIYYDEIYLNKEPVFYFIYLNIDDVFSFLRKIKLTN